MDEPTGPTISGIPVRVGEIYYTASRGIPREVVSVDLDTWVVCVKRPGALDTSAWPVKYFARNYSRKRES